MSLLSSEMEVRDLMLVRLGIVLVLVAVLSGLGVLWVRHRRRTTQPPVQETITSSGPARLPVPTSTPAMPTSSTPVGTIWPSDLDRADAPGELEKEDWQELSAVLNGQGRGIYAPLLGRNGRFRTRTGERFTLFRTTAVLNGTKQAVCVIVRIGCEGHVTARRIIVGLDRPEVCFADETRDESPSAPKGISHRQAVNAEAQGMSPMASIAVLTLTHELASATRYGDL